MVSSWRVQMEFPSGSAGRISLCCRVRTGKNGRVPRYPRRPALPARGSLKVPLAALAGHLGTELFERMEERSDVTGQQRWLLHRGEMAAAVEFGPMRDLATRSHHLTSREITDPALSPCAP